jgi:hypothetical protein
VSGHPLQLEEPPKPKRVDAKKTIEKCPLPSKSQVKGKEKVKKKTKDEIAMDEAQIILNNVQKWYPSGERTFSIPVELFHEAPSNLVCHMLSKTHCEEIMHNMMVAAV